MKSPYPYSLIQGFSPVQPSPVLCREALLCLIFRNSSSGLYNVSELAWVLQQTGDIIFKPPNPLDYVSMGLSGPSHDPQQATPCDLVSYE